MAFNRTTGRSVNLKCNVNVNVQDVCKMCARCVQVVRKMCARCVQDVCKMCASCAQGVRNMRARCEQDMCKMFARCVNMSCLIFLNPTHLEETYHVLGLSDI